MTAKLYRSKVFLVEAEQVEGDFELVARVGPGDYVEVAKPGSWVVRSRNGNRQVISDEMFHDLFEPVGGEAKSPGPFPREAMVPFILTIAKGEAPDEGQGAE